MRVGGTVGTNPRPLNAAGPAAGGYSGGYAVGMDPAGRAAHPPDARTAAWAPAARTDRAAVVRSAAVRSAGVRTAAVAATLLAVWLTARLWWDWWAVEWARSEPWRSAASWSGDLAALAACLWHLAFGRWGDPDPERPPRPRTGWAAAGVILALLADLAATGSVLWAERAGSARAIPAAGRVTHAAATSHVAAGRDGLARLTVTFPLADGRPFVGRTTEEVGPGGDPADRVRRGPPRLPRAVSDWVVRHADRGRPAPGPSPAVAVRYDPAWPARFWVGRQRWGDLSLARLALSVLLPLVQLTLVLAEPVDRLLGRLGLRRGPSAFDAPLIRLFTGPTRAAAVSLPLLLLLGVSRLI